MALCSKRDGSVSSILMAVECSLALFQTLQKSFTSNFRRKGRAASAVDLSAIKSHERRL